MLFLIPEMLFFHEYVFPYVNGTFNFTDPFTIASKFVANSPIDSIIDSFVTFVSISEAPIHSHIPFSSPSALHPPAFDTSRTSPMSNETSMSPSLFVTPPLDTSPSTSLPITVLPHTRKSTKVHKAPVYLQDYACNSVAAVPVPGSPYDMVDFLTYSHLNPSY